MIQRVLVAGVVLLAVSAKAFAVNPGNAKVSASLIADTAKIEPGKPFTVGMHLKITPHWHVYWQNAGESGLPTTVELQLPDGFTATPWQYPAPFTFDLGGVQSYGYEKEVTLLATITPPAKLPDANPKIEATVNFLVCSDVCLPGSIKASLELGGDENADILRETKQHIPVPADAPAKWTTSKTDDGWIHMQFETDKPVFQWFPNPPEGVLIRNPKIDHRTISFDIKKQGGSDVKEKSFESVLSYVDYTTERGVRRGIVIDVPMPQ